MDTPRLRTHALFLALALVLLAPARADAYVDPGSGSYLFQLLIAGGMAALYGIKHFWGKIRPFLAGLFGRH